MAVTVIIQWKWSQGRLESERSGILAKQRAVVAELGPRWFPLRDRIERWTVDLAKEPAPDVVETEILKAWNFRDKPGIYLRLDADQATSADAIRKAANDSLRDGFTACLFTAENKNQLSGKECKLTRDCAFGEICNELDRCAPPAQPYNLRVAYRAMRILSEDWVREAQETSGELRLRALTSFFEDAVRDDIPIAVDLLTRAQYFAVVLDETPPNFQVPAGMSKSEALRGVPHASRVGIWRLSDNKLVLRVRRTPDVELKMAGAQLDERVVNAQQRQALSCALANAVRDAMGDTQAGVVPPAP
ncbi:hypothetical protein QHF84_41860 [Polyangium sp. y55x31]|nr:hypothetical protein [Polyangium sp. y55x31]